MEPIIYFMMGLVLFGIIIFIFFGGFKQTPHKR